MESTLPKQSIAHEAIREFGEFVTRFKFSDLSKNSGLGGCVEGVQSRLGRWKLTRGSPNGQEIQGRFDVTDPVLLQRLSRKWKWIKE